MSEGDVLTDVGLARHLLRKHVPSALLHADAAPLSFHGRWLVELTLGGLRWGAPCASRCLAMLLRGLRRAPPKPSPPPRAPGSCVTVVEMP